MGKQKVSTSTAQALWLKQAWPVYNIYISIYNTGSICQLLFNRAWGKSTKAIPLADLGQSCNRVLLSWVQCLSLLSVTIMIIISGQPKDKQQLCPGTPQAGGDRAMTQLSGTYLPPSLKSKGHFSISPAKVWSISSLRKSESFTLHVPLTLFSCIF